MKNNVFIRHIVEFYLFCDNICISSKYVFNKDISTSTLIKYVTEVYLQVLLIKIVIDKISKMQSFTIFS